MALIGTDGPAVVLDARACAWLEKYADLTRLRVSVRGTDPEISAQLEQIRMAAMSWRGSSCGTEGDAEAEPAPLSEWLTTGQAAKAIGVTSRAIRKAIDEERIPATLAGSRWLISHEDVRHYIAARAAT